MKIAGLIMMVLFLAKGCENEKAAEELILEYTANTRGFYERITIEGQAAYVTSDRDATTRGESVKISDSDWKNLVALFMAADIEGMHALKAPTEKRFYDGAAIAKLKVTLNGKVYESAEFDHGMPPAEIAALVNKINEYSQRK
ncbi:MAG: hypothetical protein ITG00_07565 [Flavobacterium sp.]|nr:hypothetical protein [Flavobacterium sp.]